MNIPLQQQRTPVARSLAATHAAVRCSQKTRSSAVATNAVTRSLAGVLAAFLEVLLQARQQESQHRRRIAVGLSIGTVLYFDAELRHAEEARLQSKGKHAIMCTSSRGQAEQHTW